MASFIHISDPHLSSDYTGQDILLLSEKTGRNPTEQFAFGMEYIAQKHPEIDFYLLSGDVVQNGTAAEYEKFRRFIDELTGGKPCYATTGNHDTDEFRSGWFGGDGGAFDYAVTDGISGLTIIALDSRGGDYGSGVLEQSQLEWLREFLSSGEPCVIMLHHTPHIGDDEYLKYQMQNSRGFYDAVRGGNILGIFAGHTHIRFESSLGGIPCHTAPGITFGIIAGDHSMTATDVTGYNYCTYSGGVLTVENFDIPGTGEMVEMFYD